MKFVDIHTHASENSSSIQIKDLSRESLNNISAVNYYSLGIHPWYADACTIDVDIKIIEHQIGNKLFLAIGECGLDKVCKTNFSIQLDAFKRQITLSEKYEKPLILHIVKAFNELIQLRRESKSKQAWIIHGFNGSYELAKKLIDLNMYFSFGFRLNESTSKASKCINLIPHNRLFFETDDSRISIEEIYSIAACRLNMNYKQLQKCILENFQTLFQ